MDGHEFEMTIDQARQEIQKQKELPTLSPDIQRILAACEDRNIGQSALADALSEAPTIAARLLGLSNSAFFGQRGGVHSLSHAISVLGMVTVRSVAVGLALSGVLRTDRCPRFDAERYWLSATLTALMASDLNHAVAAALRPRGDSVYMAGLLHNIGLLALVHLHPVAMDGALAAYADTPERPLGQHIRDRLEIDHYQAGVWLGSKWHLPTDLLLVMEYHYDPAYRGEHWPLVQLEGLCARCANRIIDGVALHADGACDPAMLADLGLTAATLEPLWQRLLDKLDGIREVAASFARG